MSEEEQLTEGFGERIGYEVTSESIEEAWKEVKKVREHRRRRYAVAALFTSIGIFLLFLSLAFLLEGVGLAWIDSFYVFLMLITAGSLSFGYGFYRMGVS
ncbi:MAG: hypothetical protein QI197_04550 [Candidatus Korarchaeota archaeon]|nr:hypothetical protein [Candidatus Korarchaeota archaeon]